METKYVNSDSSLMNPSGESFGDQFNTESHTVLDFDRKICFKVECGKQSIVADSLFFELVKLRD